MHHYSCLYSFNYCSGLLYISLFDTLSLSRSLLYILSCNVHVQIGLLLMVMIRPITVKIHVVPLGHMTPSVQGHFVNLLKKITFSWSCVSFFLTTTELCFHTQGHNCTTVHVISHLAVLVFTPHSPPSHIMKSFRLKSTPRARALFIW